jgi:Tol biopolymer transport system component
MRYRGVIAGIVLTVLAVTLWRLTQPAPSHDLLLTQLTFDPGLTGWPAISSDGRMVAYASDRDSGSNLELYVQPIRGGSPVRLTSTSDDNSEPAFSPDGATLAYHSTKSGGGIYTVPVAGGDPHLLAAGGHTPRYSPDGRSIAYSDAAGAYIVASSGGAPRRFHPEFHSLETPAWSPDGGALLFWAQGDVLVASPDGADFARSGLAARIAKAGLGAGPFDDALWTSDSFLFSARTGVVRNLYRCPLNRLGKATGDVVRLTNGTEPIGDPSVSRDGRMVFSSGRQRYDIWGLPLDAASGQATGPPYRITDTLAPTANPDISADGRRLIFGCSRNGFTEVWEKDLVSGKEKVAATGAEGASYGRLLKTSGGILYVRPAGSHDDVYLANRQLAAGTRHWDADSQETTVLVSGAGIDALNILTKQRVPLLSAPRQTKLSAASYSPDDRWVLFLAETAPQAARIYVAPARGGGWRPVTDGAGAVGKPRFSPGGRLIYFTLDRGGTRDIWAVRFDPQSGDALGQTFPVFQPGAGRLSLAAVNPQALDIAVARDKLAMILCESTSTIWMGDPVLR